jgi:hypothetical protein
VRAAELGAIEALDDRPHAGRDPVITAEAKTWLVALACRKVRELGYPHELWATRLLAAHARQHGPAAGHPSLGKLARGTVGKILAEQEVKPHKVRYHLEQRDPEFEPKMAEILCVYRQVALLRAEREKSQGQDGAGGGSLAIVSYDEKPGIQAIGTTAPDRQPLPGTNPTVMRDHELQTPRYPDPDGRDRPAHRSRPYPGPGTPPQPQSTLQHDFHRCVIEETSY